MSKRDSPIVLILALGITVGIISGSFLLLMRNKPDWFPQQTSVNTTSGKQQRQAKITLLGDTFSGYSTFRDPQFQKTLKDVGITLTYQDEFSQSKRSEQLSQGKADLYVTTLDQFLKNQPQGKIVGLIDRTIGADAVVLNTQKYPQLKSLLDLTKLVQEKRVEGQQLTLVYAGDTPSEYLALVLDTKFDGFNLSDFEVKTVTDASEAWKMLQDPNQNVAVAVLWEPFVTQARQKGYTVVLSSQDAPTAIIDVLVASDPLIQNQPEVISNFLEAYYRRIDANMRDPNQLKQQIAQDGKLSNIEALTVLQGIDFFSSIKAKDWLNDGTLKKRINSTAAVLTLGGKLNQVPTNPDDLFTSNFISKAAQNTETLISLIRADNPELADKLSGKEKKKTTPIKVTPSQINKAQDIGNLQVRGEVKFQTGSSQLTPESKATLAKLAQEIQEFNAQTVAVKVIGHTSKTGAVDVNQKLSEARAQVVVNELRSRGLKHNIMAEGKGYSVPLAGIKPEDSRQQRTEIRLVRIN